MIKPSKFLFPLCLLAALLFMKTPLLAEDSNFVLSNPHVTLTFDGGDTYCFRSMQLRDGRTVTLPDSTTPWGIELASGTQAAESAHYLGGKRISDSTLQFRWAIGTGDRHTVTATVELPKDSPLPRWSLEADLPSDWELERISYPRLRIPLTEGMHLIMPAGHGVMRPLATGAETATQYPSGSGTMQFLMVTGNDGTAYFGTEDYTGSAKQYRCIADDTSVTLFLTATTSADWVKDGHFELPWEAVMGHHKGGWEQTAIDWYRPFTFKTKWGKQLKMERDIPEWLVNNDLWIMTTQISEKYSDLLRMMLLYGNNTGIHWYTWHNHPFDTLYPDYFPTKPEIPAEFAEATAMGAHIVPYINGRIWDPKSEAFKTYDGANNCCIKRDGAFYEEVYHSQVPHYAACPGSPGWQAIQKNIVHRIANELSTEGVYIDQIGCAAPYPCYNAAHGHAVGEGSWWVDSYRKLYTEARKESLRPGQILMTEECAECYIDIFDLMLNVNMDFRWGNKPIPLFPIVYGDRAHFTGYCYIGTPIYDGSYRVITARGLLWGGQLGWIKPSMILDPQAKVEADFLLTAKRFREKHRDLFLNGRIIGEWVPDGVPTTSDLPKHGEVPLVLGAKWLDAAGKKYLIVVNHDTEAHRITLPSGEKKELAPLTPYLFDF